MNTVKIRGKVGVRMEGAERGIEIEILMMRTGN